MLLANSAVIWGLQAFLHATSAASAPKEFDYIVVGGGTSGLVVSNRLSEDPSKTVIVLEHGQIDNGPKTLIPRAVAAPIAAMWNVTSAPVEALGNATFAVAMADVVGGGSVVNGMLADRGSEADYDAWEALGNVGWGWDGLLPYFRKSTNFTPPVAQVAEDFGIQYDRSAYGGGGPLQVGYPSLQFPDLKNATAAFVARGVGVPEKPDGGDALGVVWSPNSLDFAKGTRCHARVAYYDPVAHRPNLILQTGTTVRRILFDGSLNAVGVEIEYKRSDNETIRERVTARREVILAAGAIGTPKLLQLSGIGPREMLAAAGIEVKADRPAVGANFQDHAVVYTSWNQSNLAFPTLADLTSNQTYNASAWREYVVNHTGPYTFSQANTAAFLTLKQVLPESKANTLIAELTRQDAADYLPALYQDHADLLRGFEAQRDILLGQYSGTNAAVAEFTVGLAFGALEKPLSRGTVTIDPTQPDGSPVVQYHTLQNPTDRRLMAELLRYIRSLAASPELAGYDSVEIVPGAQYDGSDDELIAGMVETGALNPSFAHPSGTCAMMPEELGGCVGADLLVYGTGRLSVVDASVMPLIPATHLQTTVYAVAEKAADIIKSRIG